MPALTSRTLSVSVFRRPAYTRRVLEALRECAGIEKFSVMIHCDVHPNHAQACEEVLTVVNEIARPMRWGVAAHQQIGCNRNVIGAVDWGFRAGNDHPLDFHVHLEDDTLPHRDFLDYMMWAADDYYFGSNVLTISGYNRKPGDPADSIIRRWFTPWGWGTWRDRWEIVRPATDVSKTLSWDCQMCGWTRNFGRFEAAPALGLVQNIGEHDGSYNNPTLWAAEQHAPVWAGNEGVVLPASREWHHAGEVEVNL